MHCDICKYTVIYVNTLLYNLICCDVCKSTSMYVIPSVVTSHTHAITHNLIPLSSAAQWFLYYDVVYEFFPGDDSTISNNLAALVGSNTCSVRKLSCTRHKNIWSSTPVLCSEILYILLYRLCMKST